MASVGEKLKAFIARRALRSSDHGLLTYYRQLDGFVSWNLRSRNGEIVLRGESHNSVSDCERAVAGALALLSSPNLRTMDLSRLPHFEENETPKF